MSVLFLCLLSACFAWQAHAASPPGTKLWDYVAGEQIRSTPAIAADGTIYFGCHDGKLYALRPDGTLKWAFTTPAGEIVSAPTLGTDGTIYFGGANSGGSIPAFYAVNPNGTLRWEIKNIGEVNGYGCSALGKDGTIYFASHDQRLYAVKLDGTQRWALDLGDIVTKVTVGRDRVGSEVIYATTDSGKLHAVTPQGIKQWEYAAGSRSGGLSLGGDGTIYFTSYDTKLHAVNPDGTKQWQFTTGSYVIAEPAIGPDGVIYFGSGDGKLYALNPDGTKRWDLPLGGSIHSSPALAADGTIYATSESRTVFGISSEGTILWSFETGYFIQASPIIAANGTVYVGGMDSRFYAFQGTTGPANSPWPMFGQNASHTRNGGRLALTDGLVAYYPFSGSTQDVSANGNHGTANGIELTDDRFGLPDAAYQFAANKYISVPSSESLKIVGRAITLGAWVNPIQFTGGTGIDNRRTILRKMNQSGGEGGYFLALSNDGYLNCGARLSVTEHFEKTNHSIKLPLNTWSHVAMTYDGSNVRFYVNGALVDTLPLEGSIAADDDDMAIGRLAPSYPSEHFYGAIDEVRIYNRVLSADELNELYQLDVSSGIQVSNAVKLTLYGLKVGADYQLQQSVNLVDWIEIGLPFEASGKLETKYVDVGWQNAYWRLKQTSP